MVRWAVLPPRPWTKWDLPPSPLEMQARERATAKLLAALFPKKTELPGVLLKPLHTFEEDSGVLPGLSGTLGAALGNLPRLPFEGRLKSALEGKIEEAIPPMPWEGK